MMKCPIDGSRLENRIQGTVIVEECLTCRGIWYGVDELRKAMDEADPDVRWLDFDLGPGHDPTDAVWSTRPCPQCGKMMATIAYRTTGVSVDRCPDGHGTWLDKGEFQAILEALDREAESRDVGEYVRASIKEALDIVSGDEGLVSEWKDFLAVTRMLQYRLLVENPRLVELLVALQQSNPLK